MEKNWELSDVSLIKLGLNVLIPKLGKHYWVDGSAGDDSDNGLFPSAPLLTVTAALDKCIAGRYDTIHILANSPSNPPATETFPIVVDKAGVTIRGEHGFGVLSDSGIGSHTQNKACFEVSAHYVTIEDLYLGVDNLGSNGGVIEFNGTNSYFGTTIRRITFDTQYVPAYGIYLPYDQPYLLVEDCIFGRADIAGYTTAAIYIGNCTGGMLRRNIFNEVAGVGIYMGAGCGNVSVLSNKFYMGLTYSKGDGITVLGSHCWFDDNRAMISASAGPQNPYLDTSSGAEVTTKNGWGVNYRGKDTVYPAVS